MRSRSASQFLWALCLLAVGIVLLLVNINYISFDLVGIYLFTYPFLLFILGAYLFIKAFSSHPSGSLFWGLFYLILSGFLISERFGYTNFQFVDFWKLWPILFVYFGIKLLFFKKKDVDFEFKNDWNPIKDWHYTYDGNSWNQNDENDTKSMAHNKTEFTNQNIDELLEEIDELITDEILREKIHEKIIKRLQISMKKKAVIVDPESVVEKDINSSEFYLHNQAKKKNKKNHTEVNVLGLSIGDIEYKKANWPLEPMKLNHKIVDYYIDFSKAFIPDGETPVILNGVVGEITILIPEDIPVRIRASIRIGDIEVFGNELPSVGSVRVYQYESQNYQDATRKINLDITLKMGSIEIVQV